MAIALTDLGTKVKLEGDINQGVAYYKKALYSNWHYADAMYNFGVAYGEMLKFEMAIVFYELAFHFNRLDTLNARRSPADLDHYKSNMVTVRIYMERPTK